ncbi:hypothetical protein ACLE20_12505 [Rhizobium sp. YIM 134829]|uniref:hypothetical protein n=1 Tax=Rhizobium sp. YIM 134829 TaxID=3390453 RepID=UPI0039795D47
MVLLLLAAAGLTIVFFAARFTRFRRLAEPVLSVLVALLLISAFVVWLKDGSAKQVDPAPPLAPARAKVEIAPAEIALDDLTFTPSQPAGSYVATGTVRNDGAAFLDYFDLEVTLEDCAADPCRAIGNDEALVIARLPPGRSVPLKVTLVFPFRQGEPPQAPRFNAVAGNIRAVPVAR